ncbi:MAG TPA: ferritin family protein [Candidatus Bathyarchaeia archaeon]|nr:ferritin family protein [Candidatus Bathyarchaeia archaeon]
MAFSATLFQIMCLAVEAEEVGEKYYRRVARIVKDDKVKSVCLFFAEQERDHAKTLNQIARKVKHDEHGVKPFSIDVVSLLEEGIRRFDEMGLQKEMPNYSKITVNQCLEMALQAEEETIKIYQEIQHALQTQYDVLLYKIIREEMDHADTIRRVMGKAEQRYGGYGVAPVQHVPERVESGKVEVRQMRFRMPARDIGMIVMIFLLLMALVLVMAGPRTISTITNALLNNP